MVVTELLPGIDQGQDFTKILLEKKKKYSLQVPCFKKIYTSLHIRNVSNKAHLNRRVQNRSLHKIQAVLH